ncbi:ABC transporter permease [Desulfonatronospira sp.]|uniref:ABC transporter permease n=1 Tax=Desulfonatronospira sp. TaxID=1962951 RepID=UPI0025BB9AD0|nr:ABC transporter permease [Desulfonatronospira sp.]
MLKYLFKEILHRPLGLACLLVLGVLYVTTIFSQFLAPYLPTDQDLQKAYHPPARIVFQDWRPHVQVYEQIDPSAATYKAVPGETARIHFFAPGEEYLFWGLIPAKMRLFQAEEPHRIYLLGSDGTGRDVFSRLLYGAQVSLSIGFIGICITMTLGFLVGGVAGYFGGQVDFLTMRLVEFVIAVPSLYLLIALRGALAEHFAPEQMYLVIVIILSLIGWAGAARIIRGMALSLRQRPFVLAAEVMGQSSFKILFRHFLPNLASYLLVAATLSIPAYILAEASLSFLGLGIQEPGTSWGLMLQQAQELKVFTLNLWWLLTPGAAVFITVITFNMLGDVLRDIVDPRQQMVKR